MSNENIAAENTVSGQETVDDQKKKIISMAVKVDENIANDFRKLAKETGMEQGSFLKAMIENFRLNEDKTLYKEHAEDIQLMRDLTATINYKYVALIAQNRIEAEKARAKDEKKISELEQTVKELSEEKSFWDISKRRNAELEHEVQELREMLHNLEIKIEQMTAAHKNEIDALTNRHNAEKTALAQEYAGKYMAFVESHTPAK